jgi:hypothetical protein
MTAGQQAAIVASAQDWARQAASGSNQHQVKREGVQDCTPSPEADTVATRMAQSGASRRTQQMADKANPELARQVAQRRRRWRTFGGQSRARGVTVRDRSSSTASARAAPSGVLAA